MHRARIAKPMQADRNHRVSNNGGDSLRMKKGALARRPSFRWGIEDIEHFAANHCQRQISL
jgi:hypothetical protein